MSLVLRNPHSVLAALDTRPKDVVDVCVRDGHPSPIWDDVVRVAGSYRVPIRRERNHPQRSRHGRGTVREKTGRTGSSYATVKERPGVKLEQLFPDTADSQRDAGLWIALDCLQDPHNVGAIFRSAAFFGVDGIVVTQDRSAPLNATVYDVASGGVEHIPFAVQTNLARAIRLAKRSGLWVLGASEHASVDISDVPRDRTWLLVLGNEEKGLRRLSQESCDTVCRLTPRGPLGSLNVSVAAGILISNLTHPL